MNMHHEEPVIARVTAANGARITAVFNDSVRDSIQDIQIGILVKMPTRNTVAFGIINSMTLEDHGANSKMTAQIDLLGEMAIPTNGHATSFARGISVYPTLLTPLYMATNSDLAHVFARPDEASLRIGTLHQDATIPAYLLADRLMAMHFAVLGTTGTGKSCALTLLLHSILNSLPQGRIILLDPHNEYAPAFTGKAELFDVNNLPLPYWLFDGEEICGIFIDPKSDTAEREAGLLRDAIVHAKNIYNMDVMDANIITIDTPIPYQLRDVMHYLNERKGDLEKPDGTAPYLRLQTRLNQLKNDPRYKFLFPGLRVEDTLDQILSRIMRLPVNGKPLSIFDLSGVPAEVVSVVVSVIARLLFDFAVWSGGIGNAPVLLVCEEAHRYVPRDEAAGFAQTRRLLSRIAQEGRKYGIGLGLVTQRPSLISQTILSQCNTMMTLRISNDADQDIIRRSVHESAFGLTAALPALRSQEAIITGEAVTLPMRIRFSDLASHKKPRSETVPFSTHWARDDWTLEKVQSTIHNWRHKQHSGKKAEASKAAIQPLFPSVAPVFPTPEEPQNLAQNPPGYYGQ